MSEDIRNKLHMSTTSNLLFMKLNGPPLELLEAKIYTFHWLKDNNRTADVCANRTNNDDNVQSENDKPFYKIFNQII